MAQFNDQRLAVFLPKTKARAGQEQTPMCSCISAAIQYIRPDIYLLPLCECCLHPFDEAPDVELCRLAPGSGVHIDS
ncbi:hypothetical protein TcWFU_002383 [Taenia crassiceps]|uniref:Uncharacterized protein n=1 Tax=Taenia crassiceps TaxID=6207 RepID=A0ABR4QPS1_9CEST